MVERICMPQKLLQSEPQHVIKIGTWYLIRSLFQKIYLQDERTIECLEKHWKFSNFIVVIIQVSSKMLVKAMLKFVFVLKLRWVKLFIVVFSKGHRNVLQFMVRTFKSTKYSVLLYCKLCLRINNVMYQSDAHNWNRKRHLYS